MRVPGERVKRTQLVQTEWYVVAVEVEMVIPADDPSEPCYEAEAVQLLREVKERAERGDVAWLRQHGKVYEALDGRYKQFAGTWDPDDPVINEYLRCVEEYRRQVDEEDQRREGESHGDSSPG